jgi:hypothetical protein
MAAYIILLGIAFGVINWALGTLIFIVFNVCGSENTISDQINCKTGRSRILFLALLASPLITSFCVDSTSKPKLRELEDHMKNTIGGNLYTKKPQREVTKFGNPVTTYGEAGPNSLGSSPRVLVDTKKDHQ